MHAAAGTYTCKLLHKYYTTLSYKLKNESKFPKCKNVHECYKAKLNWMKQNGMEAFNYEHKQNHSQVKFHLRPCFRQKFCSRLSGRDFAPSWVSGRQCDKSMQKFCTKAKRVVHMMILQKLGEKYCKYRVLDQMLCQVVFMSIPLHS